MKCNGFNKNYQTVCDYCYFTHKYIGATHSTCNLRYETPNVNSIFCENE